MRSVTRRTLDADGWWGLSIFGRTAHAAELQALRGQLDEAQYALASRADAAHAENDELLRRLEAKDTALAQQAQEADNAIAEALEQTQGQTRQLDELLAKLQNTQAHMSALEEENADLHSRLQMMESQHAQALSQAEGIAGQLEEKENQLAVAASHTDHTVAELQEQLGAVERGVSCLPLPLPLPALLRAAPCVHHDDIIMISS